MSNVESERTNLAREVKCKAADIGYRALLAVGRLSFVVFYGAHSHK